MRKKIAIAIHGGAGTILRNSCTKEQEKLYKEKMRESIDAGYSVLKNGGNSVDAVEAALIIMENSPLFNAGKGSVYTHEGTHEMDAAIMNGRNLETGAVAGISKIKNPISLAK